MTSDYFRKTVVFVIIAIVSLFFVSAVSATDISSHKVYLEIDEPSRDSPVYSIVEINYTELTSNDIYYLVFNEIYGFQAWDDYGVLQCSLNRTIIGSEIICKPNTDNKTDYNVTFSYYIKELQSEISEAYLVNYIYSFTDPTERFILDVSLPEGMGIIEKSERLSPLYPVDAHVGTDGRRITVEWDVPKPMLGSTKSFTLIYEDMGSFEFLLTTQMYLIGGIVIVLLAVLLLLVYFRHRRGDKSDMVLSLLRSSEKKVLDIIIASGGECIQRQIVKDTGYSKAKVSRIIYDLSERDIIEKIQQGRTNIIKIKDEILKKKKV